MGFSLPVRPGAFALPPAALPAALTRVNPLVRVTLYLFVLTIPFEVPKRTIPIEIPTIAALVFLLSTLLHPSAAYRRVPAPLLWFAAYLWVFIIAVLASGTESAFLATKLFLSLVIMMAIFWTAFNLMADPRVARGVMVAIVVGTAARALMQWLGIGVTEWMEWGGGVRLSVLGQNPNLSAIILSAGLVVVIGMRGRETPLLPRLGVLLVPLAVILGVAIIQSGSRGGLLCAAVGLAVFAFRGRTPGRLVLNAVMGVAAIAILAVGAMQSPVMRARVERAATTGQLAGREAIYPAAAELIAERPVLGWGPVTNQFELARRIEWYRTESRDVHNLLLELLSATGIVGAVPFLTGIALCLRAAWRARGGALGVVPLAMLLAVLTGSISGTWQVSEILWLSLAVALAAGTHQYAREPAPVRRIV